MKTIKRTIKKSDKVAAKKLDVLKNIRLNYDQLQEINAYAASVDRTSSYVIRAWIQKGLYEAVPL